MKKYKKIVRLRHLDQRRFKFLYFFSLLLIFTLFFLSFDSQMKWSNTYKILSKTRAINNNLIDYISKIEEFYISELESINTYRKTKPEDLIYLDKRPEKKESLFKKYLSSFIEGFSDSKYQRGY